MYPRGRSQSSINEDVSDGVLRPYLSRLTLVLLNGMVYSQEELIMLDKEKNQQQDINPELLNVTTDSMQNDDAPRWTL